MTAPTTVCVAGARAVQHREQVEAPLVPRRPVQGTAGTQQQAVRQGAEGEEAGQQEAREAAASVMNLLECGRTEVAQCGVGVEYSIDDVKDDGPKVRPSAVSDDVSDSGGETCIEAIQPDEPSIHSTLTTFDRDSTVQAFDAPPPRQEAQLRCEVSEAVASVMCSLSCLLFACAVGGLGGV